MPPADRPAKSVPPDRGPSQIRLDLLWNLLALAPLAVVGLAINLIIGRYYGPGTLGTFNQVFALYVVLSQVAVGGFYFSVLAAVAAHAHEPPEYRRIVVAALALAGCLSAAVAAASFLCAPLFGLAFGSPDVAEGIRQVAPGLVFFSLNKVLLFSLNGLGYLRAFAAGQTARYLLLLAAFVTLAGLAVDGALLPVAFSVAEALLFVVLAIVWGSTFGWRISGSLREWLRRHLDFGARAYWNGLLAEINTKVDILILGIFMSDEAVGIYAFAANIAEGIAHVPVALQAVLTPQLSSIARLRDQAALSDLLRRTVRLAVPGTALAGLAAVALYPPLSDLLTGDPAFGQAWPLLALLVAGVALTAGHLPFALLLNQAGRPEAQNTLIRATVAANVVGNLALVPFLGVTGAALGTAASMLVSVVVLKRLAGRVLGLSL